MLSIRIGLNGFYKYFTTNKSNLMQKHMNILFVRKLCQTEVNQRVNSFENNMNINRLLLQNSFTKTKEVFEISGERSELGFATMYCCGPTVYDESHLGHAFTYIRCDLFRRVLDKYYGIYVVMALNITDIDDKIIDKAKQTNKHYKTVSDFYYNSFMNDMQSLNILKADCYLRVTDHIIHIMDYIKRIQEKGFAYMSSNGDINFDFEHFIKTFNISNALGNSSPITEKSSGKRSPKDFALWKSSKAGEPKWHLVSDQGITIAGRPGWHIECSALAHFAFGNQIDFHFGGFDLKFPHNHCESCCCHAFNETNSSKPLYSWANIWLHSGHLIIDSQKMSKSLGNVISIKEFLKENSPNVLRLLCIRHHYRSDLIFTEEILNDMKIMDKKLLDFYQGLNIKTNELSIGNKCENVIIENLMNEDYSVLIEQTLREILEGIADDLDLNRGLEAILLLSKKFNSNNDYSLMDLMRIKALFIKWINTMGLQYNQTNNETQCKDFNETVLVNSFTKFRSNVREIALKSLKLTKNSSLDKENFLNEMKNNSEDLLSLCDKLRRELDGFGIKLKDMPVSKHHK